VKWRKKSGPIAQRSYGVDVVSDVLPLGRLWYGETNAVSNTIDYAKFFGCSRDAVIRVYDEADNVIETHEHAGSSRFVARANARKIVSSSSARTMKR